MHHHPHYPMDGPPEHINYARTETQARKKRQRRSYSCGMCKLLKIKCDLQTPCSRCVKFKRVEKCLENPPNPPSADELSKIMGRKNRLEKRKPLPVPSLYDLSYESSSSANTPMSVPSLMPHQTHSQNALSLQSVSTDAHRINTLCDSHHQQTPLSLFQNQGPPLLETPSSAFPNRGASDAQVHPHGEGHPKQTHLNQGHISSHAQDQRSTVSFPHRSHSNSNHSHGHTQYNGQLAASHNYVYGSYQRQAPTSSFPSQGSVSFHNQGYATHETFPGEAHVNLNSELQFSASLVASDEPSLSCFGAMAPEKIEPNGPIRYILPPVSSHQGSCSKGVSLPANYTAYSAIKQLNHLLKVVESQIKNESTTCVQVSQADLQEARDALPRDFSHFIALHDNLVVLQGPLPLHIYDHDAIRWQCERMFKKIKLDKINNDQNPMVVSALEARTLSIIFLILANGCVLLPDQEDTARLWFALANRFKKCINLLNNFVDICYLTDWFYFAKAYNTHMNDFAAILRDLHVLLIHISQCKEFMACIQLPCLSTYPTSPEFVLAARYWALLRIDAFAENRFSSRSSAFALDDFEHTLAPDKSLLESVYGTNLTLVRDPYQQFTYLVWALYYKRHTASVSIAQPFDSTSAQLLVFADITALLLPGVRVFEEYYTRAISRGTFEKSSPQDMSRNLVLYLKVQTAHLMLAEWLVKQFGCGYLPSLAAAQYMTTMCNMFNHFNALNDVCIHQLAGARDLLDSLLDEVRYMNLPHLYTSLVYMAVFLVVTSRHVATTPPPYPKPYACVATIHSIALDRFQRTVLVFTNHVRLGMTVHRIPFYRDSLRLVHVLEHCVSRPWISEESAVDVMLGACDPKTSAVLTQHYFGLQDNLAQYTYKLEDCCNRMTVPGNGPGHAIGRLQVFDTHLVKQCLQGLLGFVTTHEMIQEYIEYGYE